MKSKIKTMKSRQDVKDDEIQHYMNFDKLLLEKEKFLIRQKKLRLLRNGSIGVAVIAIGVVLVSFLINRDDEKSNVNPVTIEYEQENVKQTPVAESNQQEQTNVADNNEAENKSNGKQNRSAKIEQQAAPAKKSVEDKSQETTPARENVYVQAEPINGYPDLYAYFDRELAYPQEAVADSVQGVVTVIFSIDPQGKAQHIQIENSLGRAFDREVFKVLANMPPWKPASYNGQHVNSKVSIPLTFQVKKVDTNN